MNKTLKIGILAGILAVSLSIGYYLVIFSAQKNAIDTFAQSYSDFRNQQYDTSIDSYVPVVDASNETGKENYFTYLAEAVDTKQTNISRKNNAEQALSSYNSFNQKAMDAFSENIGKLDSATSKLVEIANKINDDEHRTTATEITKYARQIQQNYGSLWSKYVERFNLQTKLLSELVKNDGDIFSLIDTLKNSGPKVQKISEDIKSLSEETDKTSQKMDDLFLSLKGEVGFKNYPDKFSK